VKKFFRGKEEQTMADETKTATTENATTYPAPFAKAKIEPSDKPGYHKLITDDGVEKLTLESPTAVIVARGLDNYFGGGLQAASKIAKPFQETNR
jgi:hypothetical protein